jgi:hypothetical protein
VLKATVFLIALLASTSIHAEQLSISTWSEPNAYQPPKSTWKNYQPPKSTWNSNVYQAPKSSWNGSPPPKRQVPESWWSDPNHQNPPKSSWADR